MLVLNAAQVTTVSNTFLGISPRIRRRLLQETHDRFQEHPIRKNGKIAPDEMVTEASRSASPCRRHRMSPLLDEFAERQHNFSSGSEKSCVGGNCHVAPHPKSKAAVKEARRD